MGARPRRAAHAILVRGRATGADPRPSLVLLAYTSAELLALIPLTPGGLGFVEVGLIGTLSAAGVPGHAAVGAVLLYRLAAFWIPIPAGGIAYLLFRRRYADSVQDVGGSADVRPSPLPEDSLQTR